MGKISRKKTAIVFFELFSKFPSLAKAIHSAESAGPTTLIMWKYQSINVQHINSMPHKYYLKNAIGTRFIEDLCCKYREIHFPPNNKSTLSDEKELEEIERPKKKQKRDCSSSNSSKKKSEIANARFFPSSNQEIMENGSFDQERFSSRVVER